MKTLERKEQRRRDLARQEREHYVAPDVDIYETKDEWVLIADMPGVNKEGVEVLLDGNELTIIGRRPEEKGEGEYIIRESRPATYRRTFILDPSIDTSRISARIEQGVLTVRLPKVEAQKPRKIEISG